MKSQPDITIRRLVVFGGYRDLEAATTWSRTPSRSAGDAAETESVVIPLRAIAPVADLPVAA